MGQQVRLGGHPSTPTLRSGNWDLPPSWLVALTPTPMASTAWVHADTVAAWVDFLLDQGWQTTVPPDA